MHIVKRQGHKEKFDDRKVYAACYAACLNCFMKHKEAEQICNSVAKEIKKWIQNKKVVTSNQIFSETSKIISKYHEDAAFMYKTHRDIS